MEVAGLSDIDWPKPWFAPFAEPGTVLARDWRADLNLVAAARGICNDAGRPVNFVAGDCAAGEPYELFIARTGSVPTRGNLHDVFNALAWLRFPKLKARLNRLQAASIARDGIGASRGALRDALTLIDENAVLLVTPRADLVESLCNHDWHRLFVRERAAWKSDVTVAAFGHALLEKLAAPYKAITAHALHLSLAAGAPLEEIDGHAADSLHEQMSPAQLMPIPVFGIPGWCERNVDPDFYSDPAVFRPANIRRGKILET